LATNGFPLGLGPGQSGHHPLAYNGSLELREHAEHLKECLAGWCGRVHALDMKVEIDAESVGLLQEPHQVLEAATKAVN
jgi:hypothetical protein